MAILDVIEWFDETGEEIVHRFPETGSAETKCGSQVVVRENQAAVFFRDGKGLDILGPGRHTLSTQNIPLLTKLLTRTIGFGSTSPFRIEVLFINMKVFTSLKWGTKEPVAFRDAELGLVRLRAFGNYTMRITQPLLFINTIVGTQGMYSSGQIDGYLKDVIVSRLNDLLGEQLDTIFNLPKNYDELGVAVKSRLGDDFSKYGIELVDFFVQAITPPEEVSRMIDEKSGMQAVGNLDNFIKFKAAKAMGDAASGGGGGGEGAGGAAAAGMGMGVGAGLGMMMPGMMFQTMQGMSPEQQMKKIQEEGSIMCPSCQFKVPLDSRFCPKCGEQLVVMKKCPKCSHNLEAEANFCSNCGHDLIAKLKCPKCDTELPEGAQFCTSCGEKVSTD
jgi:membrane protease subunit (stomatin/prohibitin family)